MYCLIKPFPSYVNIYGTLGEFLSLSSKRTLLTTKPSNSRGRQRFVELYRGLFTGGAAILLQFPIQALEFFGLLMMSPRCKFHHQSYQKQTCHPSNERFCQPADFFQNSYQHTGFFQPTLSCFGTCSKCSRPVPLETLLRHEQNCTFALESNFASLTPRLMTSFYHKFIAKRFVLRANKDSHCDDHDSFIGHGG